MKKLVIVESFTKTTTIKKYLNDKNVIVTYSSGHIYNLPKDKIGFDTNLQNGQILVEDRGMKMSEVSENKMYTEVSFMIFRTGSCLIVGNCSEPILQFVFSFIKNILRVEYNKICVATNEVTAKPKKSKLRKRTAWFTV